MGWVLGTTGTLALVLAAQAVGCSHEADDCDRTLTCPSYLTTGASSGTGWHDGGTGGGGSPAGCDPSKTTDPVADTCGVFVSPNGDDGNPGTKEKPVQTIAAALVKGTTIYACAGATPYMEALAIDKPATLYGALDCATWTYGASKKTQLTAAADAIPLVVGNAAGGTAIHDFAITAKDATAAGGSSIALLAEADVTLENVDVTAGKGAAGAAGIGQTAVMTPATADGKDGTDDAACNMPGVFGGAGGKNTCVGTDASGGSGGNGQAATSGGAGSPGNPVMMPSNAGTGQTTSMMCGAGQSGTPGSMGTAGTGARGIGGVSATGYAGPAGMLGGAGGPGQGGGGGGGARQCDVSGMFAGPSGGGGGAGGCGGAAGNAGQSGGSSFGILALGATLTLTTVSIATHDGGAGGTGGDGQVGGAGGQPGTRGGATSCAGGIGGLGGVGGPGGGGAGGHSVAVAVKGGGLPDVSATKITLGKGAAGGAGGNNDMTAQTRGDGGLGCKTLDFTSPMSPTACVM
jgi:hypothetical protein